MSQQAFKISVSTCLDYIFGTTELFITNLGFVMQHHKAECHAKQLQAWELSMNMQISVAVKLTAERKNICPQEKEIGSTKKEQKKGSTSFSSAPKTCKTYRVHSHTAIARLSR